MAKSDGRDKLEELVRQAWTLSEAEIDSIQPGNIEQAVSLLDPGELTVAPFRDRTRFDVEHPDVHLIKVMRSPEFFPFTCYHLFGKPDGSGPLEIAPFQHLILRELWTRQFPMLVGSRGLGKCQRGDTLVVTDSGITEIQRLVPETALPHEQNPRPCETVLGENGHKPVAYSWSNGWSDTIRVETRMGYQTEATPNHPVRVATEDGIVWRDVGDLKLGDRLVVDRTPSWFPNDNGLPADLAYLFGVLVGDGGYTVRGRMTITSADPDMVAYCSSVSEKYFGKPFKKQGAPYQYLLCSVAAWDSWFGEYGFNSPVCGEKNVPESVLRAPKDSCVAFLRGLMDTDGTAVKGGGIGYCSKSEKLVRTVQFLLTRFGIVSRVARRRNKKYDRDYWNLLVSGNDARVFAALVGFGLRRKNQRLMRTLAGKTVNPNVDTIPHCLVGKWLDELRDECRRYYGPVKKGTGRRKVFQELNAHRLKSYELTYVRLGRILDEARVVSGCQAYQKLQEIYGRRYFYDTVTELAASQAHTYDLYVPDGHSFVSNGLISHNSFTLGLYILLRLIFTPGSKVVIVAAAFRQAKIVFEYMERIWHASPVLRDLIGGQKGGGGRDNGPRRDIDRCEFVIGDSVAIALPLGTGEKIRGLRANYVVAEEFGSIPESIYSIVVQGFGAVTADPIQNMRDHARMRLLQRLGLWTQEMDADEAKRNRGNQSVLSGTAYYSFNHFCKYWREYRDIINTRGDRKKLEEVLRGPVDDCFNYRDYSIIRIPYELIPKGYMDEKTVVRARQITHSAHFLMEYNAVFANDSEGFFKRSLIEKCVVGDPDDPNPPRFPSCGLARFSAAVGGSPDRRYVMAVDPAYSSDKFAVVILEIWEDHRRVVFCWTTGKSDHREKLKRGLVQEHDFYRYCVRKLRDLMAAFPCERVLLDAGSGGGGSAILEAFGDPDKLKPGELPVYECPDPDPKRHKDTDDLPGLHLLELVHFRDNAWVSEANHGLKKDMEDRVLLFPQIDSLALGLAELEDQREGRVVVNEEGDRVFQTADTLESCMLEVEELKNELSTIVISTTASGLERWDTPDSKLPGSRKGAMRKDRYSALLMANMGARILARAQPPVEYEGAAGGFAERVAPGGRAKGGGGELYQGGPAWFREGVRAAAGDYGVALRRGGRGV